MEILRLFVAEEVEKAMTFKRIKHSRKMITLLLLTSMALTVGGCAGTSSKTAQAGSTTESQMAANIDTEFSDRDLDSSYDADSAVNITCESDQISVDGKGATEKDHIITISSEGTYILSGELSDGQIVIDAKDTDKIQLVLNGITLTCKNSAPILIRSADKVFLTLADGTKNKISDGGTYELSAKDANVDAAIFSKADLTINGSGSLTVEANYKHGIVSKDDLVITAGTFTVSAEGQGIYGKDCVKIKDGTLKLDTGKDGIQSENADQEDKGFIYIAGGDFTINSEGDGIQAETVLKVDGGTFNITTGGGSVNAKQQEQVEQVGPGSGKDRPSDGKERPALPSPEETVSTKGMKSKTALWITDGTITIDSLDDALHTNGDLTIETGTLTLSSGDDGMHADSDLLINGGTIDVVKSYEAVEGTTITINAGNITAVASDDGFNAAGGSDEDSSEYTGRMQDTFAVDKDAYIKINGGTIQIDASGDGLDSNGDFYVTGGTTYVNGPTSGGDGALDYNGDATISGGTVIAVGSAGMVQGFRDISTQPSILCYFDSELEAGTEIKIMDSNKNVIASFTPRKQYQTAVISAPDLKINENYTITAGSESKEISLSSVAVSNGTNTEREDLKKERGKREQPPTTSSSTTSEN